MSSFARALKLILKIYLVVAFVTPTTGFTQNGVYDVSGPDGQNDKNGKSYSDSAPNGGTGSDGSNGKRGGNAEVLYDSNGRQIKKGWDAGTLHLQLAVESDGKIKVVGQKTLPEQSAKIEVLDSLPLSRDTNFYFRAKAGAGGIGGNGGRGQDGGRGGDGSDATRYSWGGNGGDGGDGGDEGDSTDGGNAGKAGEIVLRVPIQSNDLAMLFEEVNVKGNTGGNHGVGQGVGNGGAGGSGGSSYSWTESETETYTDSQGQTQTRVNTTHHSNPGGSSGSSGSDGQRSRKKVKDGDSSPDGKFTYEIVDENGRITQYERPYDLTLLPTYTLTGDLNNNGFFEPGETITIRNLSVVNSGKSPTPKYQKIILFMADSDSWIRTHKIELTLPKVLEPGEEYTFQDEKITFHLHEHPRKDPGLLRSRDVVGPRARVTRVEREFKTFNAPSSTTIKVQYPIEITPLDSLLTLAPGEASRLFFKIRNISQQTIGKMPELDARLAHTLFKRVGGDVSQNAFAMSLDPDGDSVNPVNGILRAIEGLKPGEERVLEAFVGFQADATPYTEAIIQPELYLQSILEPTKVKLAQFEPFTLRVAKTYEYTPDADVLLIANHDLDDKALDALRATAAIRQLKMDIWDFSLYGFFSFTNFIDKYESLFQAYRGKTIVVLGNEIKTPIGNTRVQELLSPDQIIEAARRFGIKIVVIDTSGQAKDQLSRMTEPTPLKLEDASAEQVHEFKNIAQYLRDLRRSIAEVQEDLGNDQAFLGIERMEVTQRRLWGEPKEAKLRAHAISTLTHTLGVVPEGQFFVDYYFDKKNFGRSWTSAYLFSRWRMGYLHMRRSVDDSKTSVVSFPVAQERIQNPSYILSEEFQSAFDAGLNFTTKLRILNSIILGEYSQQAKQTQLPVQFAHMKILEPMTYAEVMVQTLLLDLLHEQVTIRPYGFKSEVDRKELWNKLDLLRKVTHYDYSQFNLTSGSVEGEQFIDLITFLSFFSERTLAWWEKWMPWPNKNRDVSKVTGEMLERLIGTVFADADAARQLVKERIVAIKKQAKEKKVKRDGLIDFVVPGKIGSGMLRDAEVNRKIEERVRSAKQQQELAQADQARATRTTDIQTAITENNSRLKLKPELCQGFLSRAAASAERGQKK